MRGGAHASLCSRGADSECADDPNEAIEEYSLDGGLAGQGARLAVEPGMTLSVNHPAWGDAERLLLMLDGGVYVRSLSGAEAEWLHAVLGDVLARKPWQAEGDSGRASL